MPGQRVGTVPDVPTVVVLHHSPTGSVRRLTAAAAAGVRHPDLEGAVGLREVAALEGTAEDVLEADAVLCVTPVNFGYISGALKHYFDQHFRTLDGRTDGLPWAGILKGSTDATGAVRALESIATGMRWSRVCPPLAIEGDVGEPELAAATDLAATLAASLLL